VLSQALFAQHALPEFDHSAMDGYAVRAAEVRAGASLPVVGEVRAGGLPEALASGAAMRIFTGAPLPPGADTVVIQENTERTGEQLLISQAPKLGANVRARGSECPRGALLLEAGALLGPGELGLLAAQGCSQAQVYRRPRVAILPTGDELRSLGAPARPYSIVDSNTYALAAALTQAGCEPVPLPITPDRDDVLDERIRAGLSADLLLTVGGVSVGAYDLVAEALKRAGVQIGFHKVAIKPGKPLLFGVRESARVIGLPGNPVSALVVFEIFVWPCLQRMSGSSAPFRELVEVELAESYQHAPGRTEFVRARVQREGGRWIGRLHAQQGSGALSSMAWASALVILPAEVAQFSAGQRLEALLLVPPRRSDPPFSD
jgi:molybdopterin molybdotransferase